MQERGSVVTSERQSGPLLRLRIAGLAVAAAVATAGAVAYVLSADHEVAPVQALRQLDMFYLDEPAPALDALGVQPGRPALILFCDPRCATASVSGAQVVHSDDPQLAAQYALLTAQGRVGPGYALLNADGRLRYRTFDPAPGEHAPEIQILINGLEGGR
jgi:hypothetical protein